MAGRANRKTKQRVQIDADWLLGESSDDSTAKGSWFWTSVVCLVGITGAVYSWPYASRQFLQWEWREQLARITPSSSEDVLPILLALHEINPDNNQSAIEQLASGDAEKRLIAFHLLQKRIEKWKINDPPPQSELVAFTNDLRSMKGTIPESHLLRGQLAARLLKFIGPDVQNSSVLRFSLEGMIAEAANISTQAPVLSVDQAKTRLADTKATPVRAKIGDSNDDAPTAKTVSQTDQVTARTDIPDPPSIARLHQEERSDLTSVREPPRIVGVPELNHAKPRDAVAQRKQEGTEAHVSTPTQTAETSTAPRITDFVASKPIPVDEDRPSPTVMPIRGLEKLSFESLLQHLSSSQPKIAQQAADELVRRGMSTKHLEMAMVLAQGSVEDRLQEMEKLVRDRTIDPIPWLSTLAENSDRQVRHKAIAIIGSIPSEASRRCLRMLGQRETDTAIAEQISQVLLASGAAASNRR